MQQIKNKYRYTVTDRLGALIVQPLGENDFSIEWSKETDAGKREYKKEAGGNIIFVGEAYQRLLKLEKSIYRCELQNISIQRKCGNVWSSWFNGKISLNAGEWDIDKCKVSMKFEEDKPTACFEDNKTQKVNLFNFINDRKTVDLFPGDVTIDYESCQTLIPSSEISGFYWCGSGSQTDGLWSPYYHSENRGDFSDYTQIRTDWTRLRRTVNNSITPEPEWIFLHDNGNGTSDYIKQASVYNCTWRDGENETVMECEIVGVGGGITSIKNGIELRAILNYFVTNFCPGKTVKSDFFQINPVNVSDINYVTNKPSKVKDIIVFQKSDVKRPNAVGTATRAEWSWEKLMEHLKFMFNVEWRIIGNQFIIEHVSFYPNNFGLNITADKYKKYIVGKNKYTYKNESIPKQEVWKFKESYPYGDFNGLPIVYNDGCVTSGSKSTIKTYMMDDVVTDIQFVFSNPASNSSVVSDDGFVFVATQRVGETFSIITEASILGGNTLNNSLALAQLMRDYQKHERPLKNGNMNNVETQFISVIPTKKGEKISIPICCDDVFNPDDIVVTPLGNGYVDKATFNFLSSMLDLELVYEANVGLVDNRRPSALNKVVQTYLDTEKIVDVMQGATDPDGNETIVASKILLQPPNGTAVVMPDNKVKYTPNTGFIGNDYFVFVVVDNWGEPSNNAMVSITVTNSNIPPVANDDYYQSFQGTPLYVPAPGVFENDSDDIGFTLKSYQPTTTAGGNVAMNADGSFTYIAATGFIGDDTFTYTIEDNTGAEATATVHIKVRNENYPIATADEYQTRVGVVLNVDDSNVLKRSLLFNDYTPGGGQYTYTATAETKATTAGGSVTINSNGRFVYTPPSGFIGKDTFTYTVSNGIGTDTGIVTINVMPNIYARFVDGWGEQKPIFIWCQGSQTFGGQQYRKDVTVEFYSNPAGTTPLDVTGFNLKTLVRNGYQYNGGSWGYFDGYQPVSGTSFKLWDNTVYKYYELDCTGNVVLDQESSISLLSNEAYIII